MILMAKESREPSGGLWSVVSHDFCVLTPETKPSLHSFKLYVTNKMKLNSMTLTVSAAVFITVVMQSWKH